MEEFNIPETIRQRIKVMIDEALPDDKGQYTEQIKHICVQLTFEGYKSGFKDAMRYIEEALKRTKKIME